MAARKRPTISARRAAEIFKEVLSVRREYCPDGSFFRMSDVWEWLAEGDRGTKIKAYKSHQADDYKRKAGVVAFEDRFTLVVDDQLMRNAKDGCKLSNYILAHELGHLALNHHARGAVVKNFQLFSGPAGMSNAPPTNEELEANYAAVFFQCGVAILDPRLDALHLAHRACSDVYYVRKAQSLVRLEAFQTEIVRLSQPRERVIL